MRLILFGILESLYLLWLCSQERLPISEMNQPAIVGSLIGASFVTLLVWFFSGALARAMKISKP